MANDKLITVLNGAPCTIGELSLDLLLQEDEELSNRVTQFPIENMSPASDHAVNEPTVLTITGMVTNAPVRAHGGTIDAQARVTLVGKDQLSGTDINFAELALAYLRKILIEKTPVTVVTKRGTWENMMVQRVSRSKNKATGDALVFTITMIELKKVKLLFVAAPRKRTKSARAQPKANAGKKNLGDTPAKHQEYGSILSKVGEGLKTFFVKAP
jgi:hypothetical protein